MAYQTLLYEKRAGIAYVTVNRPEKLNALNRKVMEELGACFEEVRDNEDVRAVILTGAGEKAFVAGGAVSKSSGRPPRSFQNRYAFGTGGTHTSVYWCDPRAVGVVGG